MLQTGRIERDTPVVGGHKAEVLNVKWCPHHDEVIASSSEDCTGMCPLARGAGKSLTATNLSLKVPLASS